MRVAYQGEPGAFSEAAVLRLLPDADPRPYPTFDEVFDAVTNGSVSLGVVPIENSIGGSIHRNYDLLVERELSIVGEVQVPVVHHLPGVGRNLRDHVDFVIAYRSPRKDLIGFMPGDVVNALRSAVRYYRERRGIFTSIVTTWGPTSITLSRASCPSTACTTSKPSSSRFTVISVRITSLSSTTRTRTG